MTSETHSRETHSRWARPLQRAATWSVVLYTATASGQAPSPSAPSTPAFSNMPGPAASLAAPRMTPEGAGAPVVGQPGDQVPPVARSPNRRVLPVSDEPGLWAADETRASVRRRPDRPLVTVDELLVATPSPGAPEANGCRQRLLRASQTSGHEQSRRNLPQTPRDCLTARLLLHCMNSNLSTFMDAAFKTPSVDGRNFVAERRREIETAFYWQMHICEQFRSLPDIELMFSEIVASFERQFRGER